MSQYIPENLRKKVISRANNCCEYCRISDIDSYYGFHIDHIISEKHGGKTIFINLAYACPDCNRYKGTDLGTFISNQLIIHRFYNPRIDIWNKNFETDSLGYIYALTDEGAATLKILQINHPDRIIERKLLWKLGLYK